ncbi:MAG: hypothetical protein G5Z42_00115 [Caldisphaeraceae archaeon]|nr:hypothetical protein [Caldisphaeraceae archaeon]
MVGPSFQSKIGLFAICPHYKPTKNKDRYLKEMSKKHDELKKKSLELILDEELLPSEMIIKEGVARVPEVRISARYKAGIYNKSNKDIMNGSIDILTLSENSNNSVVIGIIEVKTTKRNDGIIERYNIEQVRDYSTFLAGFLSTDFQRSGETQLYGSWDIIEFSLKFSSEESTQEFYRTTKSKKSFSIKPFVVLTVLGKRNNEIIQNIIVKIKEFSIEVDNQEKKAKILLETNNLLDSYKRHSEYYLLSYECKNCSLIKSDTGSRCPIFS